MCPRVYAKGAGGFLSPVAKAPRDDGTIHRVAHDLSSDPGIKATWSNDAAVALAGKTDKGIAARKRSAAQGQDEHHCQATGKANNRDPSCCATKPHTERRGQPRRANDARYAAT